MYKLQITSDSVQEHSFTLYDMNLRLTLYYKSILRGYQFDLYNLNSDKYITKMKGLSVCSPSLHQNIIITLSCMLAIEKMICT